MKVLVIAGPTGVGKTALSIQLAQKFDGEIISGDSLQVYRQLDIGTAKVTKEEAQAVPHYLIDIRNFSENYSAADFQKEARDKIVDITARGKLPIVVGGTGLYIQALLYDYKLGAPESFGQEGENLRQKYTEYAAQYGKEALWQVLAQKDPLASEKIHFNNERKVIRALEVFDLTGHSIAQPKEKPQKIYDDFLIALTTEREVLYERINQRVEQMFATGLLEEATLLQNYEDVQAAKGIGYREFFPYFKGQISLEEVKENIKLDSRRYAKRQLTWFRNRMTVRTWVDLITQPEEIENLQQKIQLWLEE
ncbi:tRNA (adenosine(37)-N6)-dimethylallyltransferase MiaA [Enterococcus dispar]|jgi:tRNA dimethylallyltransferase|uniref:tRNA dimethylallyltransferase n=1 Tax=Enterococcus dispar ATCC 51266 TaxID=1139219 RepID=S1ND66_9ENTE|nr:tRNA (adenosine(37)-N6)-dimethylallyltransferase MiaA [Enterococcus dispar]EOT41356.1 tRNA dimethylallyltransferase [Enterococcus dispar ATCC 51266]EOW87010.1 tRNA dimethylallyltransferase [Enterococcus dispar ATCC 51266]MCU7356744.1 tRNA (adenosine(37)-N6)-dimethylallyltransferase MiaA [Enterococcus dispar]MDT2706747.1 tRNA (adenosine(37)-N6)-dimethylallyltransferase MiaA [Enterococcus dispar]OJG38110.1 tRNA dimethylallyltransferase [Enterococcus dispar]